MVEQVRQVDLVGADAASDGPAGSVDRLDDVEVLAQVEAGAEAARSSDPEALGGAIDVDGRSVPGLLQGRPDLGQEGFGGGAQAEGRDVQPPGLHLMGEAV